MVPLRAATLVSLYVTLTASVPWHLGRRITEHYCAHADSMYCNKCDFPLHHALLETWVVHHGKKQTGTVFVVGCNDGSDVAHLVNRPWYTPRLRVYAWEMQEPTFMSARRLLAASNASVEVLHGGISDQSNAVCMREGGEGTYINTRARQSCEDRCCGGTRVQVQPWSRFVDAHEISQVTFALVDVEGHEASVIRGMELETRSATFPIFTFELGSAWVSFKHAGNWTQQSTATYLTRLGYELFLIGANGCGPSACNIRPEAYIPTLLPVSPDNFAEPNCRPWRRVSATGPRPWLLRGSALDGNALAVLTAARRRMRWLDAFLEKHVIRGSTDQ